MSISYKNYGIIYGQLEHVNLPSYFFPPTKAIYLYYDGMMSTEGYCEIFESGIIHLVPPSTFYRAVRIELMSSMIQ